MGWVLLSLRRNELQTSIQDIEYDLLQLNRKKRNLSAFANAVGDGKINPAEIGSFGTELFGEALDFMGYSNDAAAEAAMLQTDYYSQRYSEITEQQYFNNPAIAAETSLYFDGAGNLNTQAMYNEFYEKALEDFTQTYIMPKLNELEKEMANEQTQLEVELQSKEAELETVKENISQSIQSSTIQL